MSRALNPAAQKQAMARLIRAGITDLALKGLDQVSVQSITQAAGISRPTFYSYFGDINGFLAEIWLAEHNDWLTRITDFDQPLYELSIDDLATHKALSQILAASHRIPEVAELVEPRILAWWDEVSKGGAMSRLKLLWLVSERLGVTLTKYSDPSADKAAFIEPYMQQIPEDESVSLDPVTLPLFTDQVVDTQTLEARLLKSAIEVIASSGVAATSMARIARRANVSTGAVYPRFPRVDVLIEDSFDVALKHIVSQNYQILNTEKLEADEFGIFIKAALLPSRRTWRNFRIEIYLGATSRPALSKRLEQSLSEMNKEITKRIAYLDISDSTKESIPYLIHAVGIGFAILQNCGIPVGAEDHRLISRELFSLALVNY